MISTPSASFAVMMRRRASWPMVSQAGGFAPAHTARQRGFGQAGADGGGHFGHGDGAGKFTLGAVRQLDGNLGETLSIWSAPDAGWRRT